MRRASARFARVHARYMTTSEPRGRRHRAAGGLAVPGGCQDFTARVCLKSRATTVRVTARVHDRHDEARDKMAEYEADPKRFGR